MSREYQIPGSIGIQETGTRQFQIPGGAGVQDTQGGWNPLPASTGSFTFTGNEAQFADSGDNPILTAAPAPFIVTGLAAILRRGKSMQASTGAFVFSGAPSLSDFQITSQKGTFTLSGNSLSRTLTAARGTFILSGNDFTGIPGGGGADPIISAETGVFAFVGKAATLIVPVRTLTASSGSFLLTGQSIVGTFRLAAEAGSFALSGKDATLSKTGPTPWTRITEPSTTWTRVS